MELLIPGLLLVALMVYASTRIKKVAAAAFDAETVESDDFVIQKPEGFLNNLNGDPKYALDIYSKEFGVEGAADIRQGRINLTVRDHETVDDAVAGLKSPGDDIIEDITEIIGPTRYRLIDSKRVANGVEFYVTDKIAEKDGRVYMLEALRLVETSDEFARKIEVMVGSFELK